MNPSRGSNTYQPSGIFASEFGHRFLHILNLGADRAFRGLYDKCQGNVGEYYQEGLRRVHKWSDEIIREDCDFVARDCPDVEDTYRLCFEQFVLDRYRPARRVRVCPSLTHFHRVYLEMLGRHEMLTSGDFFLTSDRACARMACMDACRLAFEALVKHESTRVELVEEDEPAPPSVPPERAPADVPPERALADVPTEEFEVMVGPSDSASQVQRAPSPDRRSQRSSILRPPPRSPERRLDVAPSQRTPPKRPALDPSPPPVRRNATSPARSAAGSVLSRHEFRPAPRSPPRSPPRATGSVVGSAVGSVTRRDGKSRAFSHNSSVSIGTRE